MPDFKLESVARAICKTGGFEFGSGIAEGSFKETYQVVKSDGTRLAMKVLKPGSSPERSEREVEAMQRCTHANIAKLIVLANFTHEGQKYTFLVEEFMDGGTLDDHLKSGLLGRDAMLDLGAALIDAIAHIAAKELVHRDLKPANIMFRTAGGAPVVVDFGIVRDLRKSSLTGSYLGMGPGTPYFAPPEQLNNEKMLIDWRADQFALGIVLSLAYLGFHPYAEVGDDPGQTITRVAARAGPAARFLDAVAVSALPILGRMVSKWPVERIRTPNALLDGWTKQKTKA